MSKIVVPRYNCRKIAITLKMRLVGMQEQLQWAFHYKINNAPESSSKPVSAAVHICRGQQSALDRCGTHRRICSAQMKTRASGPRTRTHFINWREIAIALFEPTSRLWSSTITAGWPTENSTEFL